MVLNSANSLGNRSLFDAPKSAFLCSKSMLPEKVLKCYDWATEVRDQESPIMGGFQAPLERDVLGFLLKGKVPIIIVLARSMYRRIPKEWRGALDAERLLIISVVESKRVSVDTAKIRNQFIVKHADHIVVGSLSGSGSLAKLLAQVPTAKIQKL